MGHSLMQVLSVVCAISLFAGADVRAVIKSLDETVLYI